MLLFIIIEARFYNSDHSLYRFEWKLISMQKYEWIKMPGPIQQKATKLLLAHIISLWFKLKKIMKCSCLRVFMG